eukprot:13244-Heterococcus_DN1.PRE.1
MSRCCSSVIAVRASCVLQLAISRAAQAQSTVGKNLSLSSHVIAAGAMHAQQVEWLPDKVYLYSLEKGFLLLRQDLRAQHSIVATNVTIPVWDECFGTPIRHDKSKLVVQTSSLLTTAAAAQLNAPGMYSW